MLNTLNMAVVELMLRLMLNTLDKRYEALVAEYLEANPVIELIRAALVNILKLCRASSKLHGGGEDLLKVTEEAEGNRRAIYQYLYGKQLP
jgi:hypothetical protein